MVYIYNMRWQGIALPAQNRSVLDEKCSVPGIIDENSTVLDENRCVLDENSPFSTRTDPREPPRSRRDLPVTRTTLFSTRTAPPRREFPVLDENRSVWEMSFKHEGCPKSLRLMILDPS